MSDLDPIISILVPVTSSNVAAVGHDPSTNTLFVAFRGGGLYAYLGVPARIAADLRTAASVGGYLHVAIKPTYDCHKLGVVDLALISEAA